MGGRGSTSGYVGRFRGGTTEQLGIAKRNLENHIRILEQSVKSQTEGERIAPGMFTERLKVNKESLKGVKEQYDELKREYKRRKLKFE